MEKSSKTNFKLTGIILNLLLVVGLFLYFTPVVQAYCDPPECDAVDPNTGEPIDNCNNSTEHCEAKCCVANNSQPSCQTNSQCGAGGRCCNGTCSSSSCGGGFEYTSCPAGTSIDCSNSYYVGCMRPGACNTAYFPSQTIGANMEPYCDDGQPANGRCYAGCTCEPPCFTTQPTNLVVTRLSPTSTSISFTPGTGGTKHYLYVSNVIENTNELCATGGCVVSGAEVTSPHTVTGLNPGTFYFYRVLNWASPACTNMSAARAHLTSCSLTPNSLTLAPGQTATVTANVGSSTRIQRIDFSSTNPSAVSIDAPVSDTAYAYQATARGNAAGSATLNAVVYSTTGSALCSTGAASAPGSTPTIATVGNTSSWWQVEDGDVTAANGDISSDVPSTQLFDVIGNGGFPGIPVYTGSLSTAPGGISVTDWNADTPTTLSRVFDYNYFESLLPDSITPTTPTIVSGAITGFPTGANMDGYEVFKVNGNVSINSVNLLNRKVILLVDNNGDLSINGSINVNDNVGFFGAFVDGSITVSSSVTGAPSIEGIYLTDEGFSTGAGTSQLHVRGSVASFGPVSLQRDLSNNATAAEYFEYAPDQIVLFPRRLAFLRTRWAEIAP